MCGQPIAGAGCCGARGRVGSRWPRRRGHVRRRGRSTPGLMLIAPSSEAIEVATIILAGVFGEAPFVRKVAYEAVYPGKGIFPHR